MQLRGFRPGKVPVTHLKKIYGKAVMAETVEAVIRELNAKIVSDRGLKLAMEPKVTIPNEETEVEKIIGGQSDLAYTLALEVLPKIELADFKGIKLERLVAEVKTGEAAPSLATAATRRQLLEYHVAFAVDGVLLVCPERGAIHRIEFSLPAARRIERELA